MTPSLDIVIVNWNAGQLIAECFDSLAASDLVGITLSRVIVVDNASSDGSVELLSAEKRIPLTLIANQDNVGFAAGCNQGAAGSQADYLLFLNPDTRLPPRTLVEAVDFMQQRPDVGISGIRLTSPQGETQRCCARFPTPWTIVGRMLGLDRLAPELVPPHFMTEWDHQDERDVPQVMGAFLLIRRDLFESIHGFDERFFLYYDDVDLCLRGQQTGKRCVHNPQTTAIHLGGGTTNCIKGRRIFYSARSMVQYVEKHFSRTAALWCLTAALICEPLSRSSLSLMRGRTDDAREALKGAAMLWRTLPGIAQNLLTKKALFS